jgi:hypothetical protein
VQNTSPIHSTTLLACIESRQTELNITDAELGNALGFEKPNVITLIKTGVMRMPLSKVPALAQALNLPASELLETLMRDTMPEVFEVIQQVYQPMVLTDTESRLIKHLRGLTGDRSCSPLVIDGASVVALVAA